MKKVLTIALALLFVLTAVSSFAIVDRGNDITGKKVWFDGIAISTSQAMADYTVAGVSAIADPAGSYVGNEMIFGVLKFGFDDNRPDANTADIKVNIMSDYATFPMYLNSGYATNAGASSLKVVYAARAHFVDKNGMLTTFPIINSTKGTVYTNPFSITADTTDEEFDIVFHAVTSEDKNHPFYSPAGYWLLPYIGAGYGYLLNDYKNDNVPSVCPKSNDAYATTMYVGFNGIVKDSTATQGVIKAYITSGGDNKFLSTTVGTTDEQVQKFGPFGGNADTKALYIDKYKDGKPMYRVYKLMGNAAGYTYDAKANGYEYLVQPFDPDDRDYLLDWAVGFQNAGPDSKRFSKITYREGLNTDKTNNHTAEMFKDMTPGSALFVAPTNVVLSDTARTYNASTVAVIPHANQNINDLAPGDEGLDLCYDNNALYTPAGSDKGYRFFKTVDGTPVTYDKQFTVKNELDSKINPIMEYFGFSFGYWNATRDSDYEGGGWKDYKEATFNYFGASIPTSDDDVIPAETGDASATIVIVMAASALLAAAALFFVMKKARD